MYFVVVFKGPQDQNPRCMGFCFDKDCAESLVSVFGEGASYEEAAGDFPTCVYTAAAAYELSRARKPLRLITEAETAETLPPPAMDGAGDTGAYARLGSGLFDKVVAG